MVLPHVVRRATQRLLLTSAKPTVYSRFPSTACRRLPIITRQFHNHPRILRINPILIFSNVIEDAHKPPSGLEIVPPDPLLVHQILSPDPDKPFKIDLSKTPKSEFDPAFAAAIRDDGTIDYDKFDLTKIDLSDELNFSPIMARAILLKPGLSLEDPFFLPPGGKPGVVPTDLEQSTGVERYELLGRLAGLDLFGMDPLPSDKMGTVNDPVIVYSSEPVHYIGCSGVPADSHDTLYMRLEMWSKHSRCKECGCVYKMKFTGIKDPNDPAQKPQTWLVDPEGEFYGFDNHGGPQVEGPWQKNWFNVHGIYERDLGDGKSR